MKSVLNIHWKGWYWSWSSNTLATWCKELTHWERPWCWKRVKVGGEGDNRWWDGWMASLTWWTWVWASSGSWWWTGMPGVLQSMGSQRVEHDWVTEVNRLSRIWDKYLFSEDVEKKKRTLCTLGTQIRTATMENNLVGPQKIKNRTTIWSSNSTSRYISNVNENSLLRHTCIPMFTSALFTIAKIRKQVKYPSIHELIKQRWYTHSEECYSATRKVESVVFARKMVDCVVDMMWYEIS